MHGHIAGARLLLERGAQLDAIPGGFDYSGTALHYAALHGRRAMVEFLIERGADVRIKDTKVGQRPAGWADHGGHPEIRVFTDLSTAVERLATALCLVHRHDPKSG